MIKRVAQLWQQQSIRYLVAGGYNTVFGYGAFVLLYWLLYPAIHYLLIAIITHFLAITNAFLTMRLLVFRSKGQLLAEYLRFNLTYLGIMFFSLIALPLLVELAGLHILLAQFILLIVSIVAGFVIHRRFTFRRK